MCRPYILWKIWSTGSIFLIPECHLDVHRKLVIIFIFFLLFLLLIFLWLWCIFCLFGGAGSFVQVHGYSWDFWQIFWWSSGHGRVPHLHEKSSLVDDLSSSRGGSENGSSRGWGVHVGHIVFIVDHQPPGWDVLASSAVSFHGWGWHCELSFKVFRQAV